MKETLHPEAFAKTRAEGNRRLLVLADKLDTVPPNRFQYDRWVGGDWGGAADLSCGTTACAIGWATTIPEFQKLGLILDIPKHEDGTRVYDEEVWADPALKGTDLSPFGAIQAFFHLPYDHAFFLFMPKARERDASAGYVAQKIRTWVEANPA